MKSNLQNKANLEPESGISPVFNSTNSFSKLPDSYWSKKWYLKPNHHIIFNYLIYQAKWAKGGNSIGRISIGTYELSEKLNIPQKTVHRILKFLEKQGEIILTPTTKFTIVTVTHLKSDLQNEKNDLQNEKNDLQNIVVNYDESNSYESEGKKVTCKTEKVTYKTKKMTTPIDIDIIDINTNKINFVEENILLNKEKTQLKTQSKPKSVQEVDKPNSFIDKLLQVWSEEYLLSRGIQYVVIKGKDSGAISNLLNVFKSEQPDLDTQGLLNYFRTFFKQVLALDDTFIYKNANPAFVHSQINLIRTLLKTSKKKSYSSVGQAPAGANYNLPLKKLNGDRK